MRKDYKVLLVDVSGLPAQFGSPPDTKGDVALNVAAHDHGLLDRRLTRVR